MATELADRLGGRWDAVVIGAGVAGSVCAALLAERGWRVVVVEKGRWPREKACGGCVNAEAVGRLRALGLRAAVAGLPAVERVVWRSRGRMLEMSVPGGVAVLRAELDARLMGLACGRGAEFIDQAAARVMAGGERAEPAVAVMRGEERVVLRARLVLACDGINGRSLAEEVWARWRIGHAALMGAAMTGTAAGGVPGGEISMHIGEGGYVGLVRVRDGRVHAAAALEPGAVRRAGGPGTLMGRIVAESGGAGPRDWRFENAARGSGHVLGTGLLTRRRVRLGGWRVLAVGDACGYVEPFTGEGMAWAIRAAELAVETLPERGTWDESVVRRWEARHAAEILARQRWCRWLRPMMHRPAAAAGALWLGGIWPAASSTLARRVCGPVTALE